MVQFASNSHVGRVYQHNEDAIGSDVSRNLWLVADGMGGHAGGEVASAIVRDTVLRHAGLSLTNAILAAHRTVAATAQADERLHGMGSTIVAVALHGSNAEVVWVGDSRAYLWRRGDLTLISRDHSYLELLRDENAISEAEMRTHPQRNLVTQTLGHGDPMPSSAHVRLRARDWLMLCSDGLNDELTDDEIAALLRDSDEPVGAVAKLIDGALARGGRDNVSVVVVAVSDDDAPSRRRRLWRYLRPQPWFPAVFGAMLALVLGALWWASLKFF
jgi:protein phosphatase